MEAPPSPKPDCLPPSPGLVPPSANQYTGIAYIIFDRLVDNIVLSTRPWTLHPTYGVLFTSPNKVSWQLCPKSKNLNPLWGNQPHILPPGGGCRTTPTPEFALQSKYFGQELILPCLQLQGPPWASKACPCLEGFAGPGQTDFSFPGLPVQAYPLSSNLGFPIRNPFFNQDVQDQECLLAQSKFVKQTEYAFITPATSSDITNDHHVKDRPLVGQTAGPEDLKNNNRLTNQTTEFKMPKHAT
ncbi:hypothetical protein DSO57_1004059 [Entomophthora muscae]|uniref:Uncharacterized protein n=1 Tax=Entomophthora muscae TaxID=34485 RepID=A0ACC2U653_9FUNG|nr:hypothetical protein DSO57_1004059 [Entomophthora muscae]